MVSFLRRSRAIAVQVALVLCALVVLTLAPPESGPMLLVPLAGGGVTEPLRIALAHDARLLGEGPLPGSIVVVGRSAALAPDARAHAMLLLAAPFVGCGKVERAP